MSAGRRPPARRRSRLDVRPVLAAAHGAERAHAATAGDPGDGGLIVKERPELRDAEVACYGEEDVSKRKGSR